MKYQNFLEVIIFYEVGFMFLNGGFGDTLNNAVCDETKKEGDEEGDDCLVVINQSGMDNDCHQSIKYQSHNELKLDKIIII